MRPRSRYRCGSTPASPNAAHGRERTRAVFALAIDASRSLGDALATFRIDRDRLGFGATNPISRQWPLPCWPEGERGHFSSARRSLQSSAFVRGARLRGLDDVTTHSTEPYDRTCRGASSRPERRDYRQGWCRTSECRARRGQTTSGRKMVIVLTERASIIDVQIPGPGQGCRREEVGVHTAGIEPTAWFFSGGQTGIQAASRILGAARP